jgi:hypothetical protein
MREARIIAADLIAAESISLPPLWILASEGKGNLCNRHVIIGWNASLLATAS